MGLPVYMLEPQQQAAFFCRGRFYGEVCAKQFWMQYTFLSTAVALHVRNRSRASLTRSVLIKVGILNDFVSHGPVEARRGGAHRYTKDQEKASCQAHPAVWLDRCALGRLTPTSDSQHSHRPSLAHVPPCVALSVCPAASTNHVWCVSLSLYVLQPDDMERFMFFSRAALEFMVVTGRQPDVLHLHDWQSSTVVRAAGHGHPHVSFGSGSCSWYLNPCNITKSGFMLH